MSGLGVVLCNLSEAHSHTHPRLWLYPAVPSPQDGEAGTGLGINEIAWIQATCGKPLSTTQLRDSFPQKCQGQGLQGMTLWDLPPLSLLRVVHGVDIFQQTFQMEASSRRKEPGARYSSCPDCADTFCVH